MPPPDSHLMLSDEEKAMLIQWVDNGATYQEHWSLTKIQKPKIPNILHWCNVHESLLHDQQKLLI